VATVRLEVSKQKLILIPDSNNSKVEEICDFDVAVINLSDKFASFEIELSAKGTDVDSDVRWYSVDPEIGSKIQPGDRTKFHVAIIKPPLPTYNTTIELTLKVFSVEFEQIFATEVILLTIKQPLETLQIDLPFKELKVYPGDTLDIPVNIHNFSPKFKEVSLKLEIVDADWFNGEILQQIHVDGGNSQPVKFRLTSPEKTHIFSKIYDFTVKAEDQEQNSCSDIAGRLEILPYGEVKFDCPRRHQKIPSQLIGWLNNAESAKYQLEFTNTSNLAQQIAFNVSELNNQPITWKITDEIQLKPGEEKTCSLVISKPRSWWRSHKLFLQVTPILSNPNTGESSAPIQANPHTEILELKVISLIPMWLQLGLGLLGLWLLLLLFSNKAEHNAPVYAVRLIGNGATVISGSSDKTIRRWQVERPFWKIANFPTDEWLKYQGEVAEKNQNQQPIRVIRELPANNEKIAAGLDNGEVGLWQISPPKKEQVIFKGNNNRVFALAFSQDSKTLFSGHGSGDVYRWDMSNNHPSLTNKFSLGQPVTTLAVIETPGQQLVAIAGRYNKFFLWDSERNQTYPVYYYYKNIAKHPQILSVFSQYNYITSLAFAKDKQKLVTADDQGFISLWDVTTLRGCMTTKNSKCENALISQWQHGQDRKSVPVRSIDITDDGCYVASAGDDGRVALWEINKPENLRDIARFSDETIRSINIKKISANEILVAVAAPNNQVKVYRQGVSNDCK